MADDRLTEIAARVAAASPGTWCTERDLHGHYTISANVRTGPTGFFRDRVIAHLADGDEAQVYADAAFIRDAHETVPWLLAQLEQARAIAVALEQEKARLREEVLSDAADRIERRAAQLHAVWLRADEVCAVLRRLAVDAGIPASEGGVS
ncbi:hypothetical protein [Streptomyces sp. S186]|uniref:hypothetical protein n=1 Tax=Streptomyces sp. S186 TaxID=3434395 RepID=UPI003F664888